MNHPAAIQTPVVHQSDVIQSIERDPVATYRAFRGNLEADELTLLPEHMQASIARYVLCGVKPGSFLLAIFADALESASFRAAARRPGRARGFLENGCPASCWGGPEAVRAWIEGGGIVGLMQKTGVSA